MDIYGIRITTAILWGSLAVAVLSLIACGRMLKKAGENPWKILIPIYGGYLMFKIANSESIFWGTFAVSVISNIITSIVSSSITQNTSYWEKPNMTPLLIIFIIEAIILLCMQIYYVRQLADAFGKNGWFALGLFLLFPIFAMILGFGSAVYGGHGGLETIRSAVGTWTCPKCGAQNPQHRGACQGCGTQK